MNANARHAPGNGTNPPTPNQGLPNVPGNIPAWNYAQNLNINMNGTTKLNIHVAALNIYGHGNVNVRHHDNKWFNLWSLMRDEKIGVLITGEAHLNEERQKEILKLFGRKMEIKFTEDPITPNARGLAFVLNKNMVKTDNLKTWEIIPGRAMLLEMENVDGERIAILGVYAPNIPAENEKFWNDIRKWFENHPRAPKPGVFGGDLNLVEDPIDRLPSRGDSQAAVSALDELKSYLHMMDGWRETYPTTKAYTYLQTHTGSQSRIDRIMVKRSLFEQTYEWDIKTVGIRTDHRMVTVKVSTAKAPTIGHGRWVWPAYLSQDKTLSKYILEKGLMLQGEIDRVAQWETWDEKYNAQTIWAKFKEDIVEKARERAKIKIPLINREIAERRPLG
ncbi:Endonuclease/exonuclease/phosphatase [Mycena alexandri]|uniref:Endonuclease/exonuclease/phosphatase n=1 Tax=Mycena alexandri TaxID=1745969 RepID=A0AAD6XDI3_9AGAR|nr:Endonuclease/exonuclease/phosphatase [Mycena alexandri]